MAEDCTRPTPGEVETRAAAEPVVEGRKLRGRIPYGIESRDIGFREVIEEGALRNADLSDLIATRDHDVKHLLGRYPNTLTVSEGRDGLDWSVELPQSPTGEDVRTAVERGDLNASSWRMVVAKDRWEGGVRHVEQIRALRDVAVVATSAYPADATRAELRAKADEENNTSSDAGESEPIMADRNQNEGGQVAVEDRSEPENTDERRDVGELRVEDRDNHQDGDAAGTVESRVYEAMSAVPQGEVRSLTHATTEPVQPDDIQRFVFDRLRDTSVVIGSGVRVIDTSNKTVKVPVIIGDVEADFYDEEEQITEDDPVLDEFSASLKNIKALVGGSSEAFEDSDPDLLGLVRAHLTTVLGLRADRAYLVGDASADPKGFDGLWNIDGAQTLAVNGAIEDYDPLIKAAAMLDAQNVPGPYVAVVHPLSAWPLRLAKTDSTDSNETLPVPEGAPPIRTTSQVGLDTSATPADAPALVYAPNQVVVVRRTDSVVIDVDRSEEFSKDRVKVRAKFRTSLGVPQGHEKAIVKLTGVDAANIT